jgi:hypothetical protein
VRTRDLHEGKANRQGTEWVDGHGTARAGVEGIAEIGRSSEVRTIWVQSNILKCWGEDEEGCPEIITEEVAEIG